MKRYLPAGLLVALLVAFRLLGLAFPESMPNFQPLAAAFFCAALVVTGWRGFLLPLTAWLLSYPVSHTLAEPFVFATTLGAFALMFALGSRFNKVGVPALLLGSLGSALLFHTLTGGAAWLGSPLYPKSLIGLWQSLWAGPVGSEIPSWVFLRNMAAANLLYTAIFALARVRWSLKNGSPAASVPAVVRTH